MSTITLEQLKKQNPRLYVECIEEGVKKERARCLGLLPNSAPTPGSRYTLKCIKEGMPYGNKQISKHLVFRLRASKNRALTDQVITLLERRFGINHDDFY